MSSPSAGEAAVLLPPAERRMALVSVLSLILLGALDQMTVSVALPSIARSLGNLDGMAWVVSGYMIAATVVTPVFGRAGDVAGRQLGLHVALVLFMVGSAGSAMSTSLPMLVAARLVQGAGAGGLLTLSQGVVADIVALRERGRFQGYTSIVWASASALGPIGGALVAQYLSWRWIFWFNIPIALAAMVLVQVSLRGLPRPRGGRQIDWWGALLLLVGLVALMLPITRIGQGARWMDPSVGGSFAVSIMVLGWFWMQQKRSPMPVIPRELFGHPVVRTGSVLLFVCFAVFVGMCVLVPLRLQLVVGWNVARAGAFVLWLTLAIPFTVFLAGRWMLWSGTLRPLQAAGSLTVAVALCALAAIDPGNVHLHALFLASLGIGIGMQVSTTMLMVQNAVPRAVVGTATALIVFFRSLGGAIGIAVLSSVVFSSLPAPHLGASGENDSAFRLALLIAAGVAAVSVLLIPRLPDTRLKD